jgi:hypothetical protein
MRIDGAWRLCDDGVIRPVFQGEVLAADGTWEPVTFLADSGADRTVFSAEDLGNLALPPAAPAGALAGVGGSVSSVLVDTRIRLRADNGAWASFNGRFAAFADPAALDMSVLGRDITNLFALIVDRPQDVVCLVGQGHRYVIV